MTTYTFQSHTLKAHSLDGTLWFESADIATALNYANKRAVTGIYANYKAEFAEGMSMVLESSTNGINNNLRKLKTRVFSLRGVHLIAMFARTPVAEDFRKWVLDLIEKEETHTLPVDNRRGPYRKEGELPAGVYHHQSKYNPYRAYASSRGKTVYVGCFPTAGDASAAIDNYFRTGVVQRLPAAIPDPHIEIQSGAKTPTPQPTSNVRHLDLLSNFATILEAAQLLSCYENGKELAWELIAFTQETAQRATA